MKGEQRYCWFCGRAFVVRPKGGRHWFCSTRCSLAQARAIRKLKQTEGRVAQAWEAAA